MAALLWFYVFVGGYASLAIAGWLMCEVSTVAGILGFVGSAYDTWYIWCGK